jgi:hypothetical protein
MADAAEKMKTRNTMQQPKQKVSGREESNPMVEVTVTTSDLRKIKQ